MRTIALRISALALSLAALRASAADPATTPGKKPDAIRTDGVPAISPRIFESLHRYQEIRSASFADWTPEGGMIVSSRIGNLSQLYSVASPGAAPVQLTAADDPVTAGRSLPDGSLLFSRGSGGDESFQILRAAKPWDSPRLLTDGKSRNLLGPLDADSARLAFTSTRRNGKDADLLYLDLKQGGEAQTLFNVDRETWSLEDWSADGKSAIVSRFVSANETHGWLLDLGSRQKSPLPLEPEARSNPAARVRRDSFRFGPGSKSVYFTSDARGEFRELARLDLATGECKWLTDGLAWDVEELDISRDGKSLAFTVNADGYSRLLTLDLRALERGEPCPQVEISLPPGTISNLRFSPASNLLGFTWGSASSPTEACSCAARGGKLERWTSSERAGFTDQDFIAPELIHFPSFDGKRIPALVYRTRAPGNSPVIVNIHGGPEGQSRPTFSARTQYHVRELGAAVILPNARGSTGYGKTFSKLDDGPLREDSVRDIGALLDWIAKDGRLDPARVSVIGGSYGGYMVLASLVHFGERLKAGVDMVGISNFRTFLENTSAYRRDLRRVEYGDERDPKMREIFEKISPANRIAELKSALFVVHGANDPRVPLSEAEQIVAKARSSGQPVWTLYAANEGHGFTRRENADYQDAVTVLFLERQLLGLHGAALHQRAVEAFRAEKFRESAALFDEAVALGGNTHSSDACWERGLARYYAGDFEGGRKQFEGYHRVGPLDIENGLWLFLCVAEKEGIEKARAALPKYDERQRRPFPALLDLYLGKGSVEAVFEEARKGLQDGPELNENLFYAHLYAGKYLQATGEKEKAREHFAKALEHPVQHFMLWCAKAETAR